MDTSETYIKMCDCEEIQDKKPFDPYHNTSVWHDDSWGGFTWLPRQDELQEMVIDDGIYRMLYKFDLFYHNLYRGFEWTGKCFSSMEQLWLAFVMKYFSGKVWDGEGWRLA
ncbi:hypothetical protein LCGC14_1389750 [marine sediment metagenome]|uniref:Uncharacterized protein n=1 Tax=marine sediment metagenome TaxID=412755 RepID=A0A0F9KL33_9ZZZZ